MKRARGRPRQYDEGVALEAAGEVFWTRGFSATSLDHLSAAMGMNRPSIYRAFGDKEAIYRRTLMHFCELMNAAFERTVVAEDDIRKGLTRFYEEALTTYTRGEIPRGCLVMSTAAVAATCHPEVRSDLLAIIRDVDEKIAARLRRAMAAGQIPTSTDIPLRAAIAQGILHTLSLRVRAGETKRQLRRIIKAGIELVLS